MKKALSLVLTMCIVLSLFATFVVSASAAASSWTYAVDAVDSELTAAGVYTTYESWLTSNPWWKYSFQIAPTSVKNVYTIVGSSTEGKCTAEMGDSELGAASDAATVKSALGFKDGIEGSLYITLAISDSSWSTCYYAKEGNTVYFDAAPAVGANVTFYSEAVEITGNGDVVEWKPFWLTHFNDKTAEGSGVIFTEAYTGAEWWYHVVFAPVAGEEGAYEITAISSGLEKGEGVAQAIPEGGFVYCLNYGNNYPEINADGSGIDYTSPNCNNMITDALTWKVGDKYMFKNVDLEGKTVPTSTEGTNWYDDAYVCTAQYAAYVPGYSEGEEGGEVVITKGDNVALNKTYAISGCGERTAYYAKLTDGKTVDLVCSGKEQGDEGFFDNNTEWFGFYCNGEDQSVINAPDKVGTVTIDLTKATDIYSVKVNVFDGDMWGIVAPASVKVSFSNDGETFTGETSVDVVKSSKENSSSWVEFVLDEVVNAQYVKVTVNLNGTFAFLNEIEVYEAVKTVSGDNKPEVIVETITVDGNLNDTGWAADGWVTVTPDNGYWQSVPETDTLSYKYQLRTDDTKLYAAFVIDCAGVNGGNGNGTNVRFWINSDSEYQLYTHFYDVFLTDGAAATGAKYNTAKDANTGAAIENSTINAVVTTADGKTYVEFSVDLAEFGGEEGFNYYICVSNKVNENVCLYYPAVAEGESRGTNLPWSKWYTEGQATVDVEAIQLGEVVVDGGTDDNLGDAGIYAIAALAIVALIGTAVVIKRRA